MKNKSGDDIEKEEDDSYRQRKKVKISHLKGSLEHEVYCNHPLSVLWHIYDEGQKGTKLLTLRFEYLMKLKVVCAGIEKPQDSQQELLMQLFPDDIGLHLPTQAWPAI